MKYGAISFAKLLKFVDVLQGQCCGRGRYQLYFCQRDSQVTWRVCEQRPLVRTSKIACRLGYSPTKWCQDKSLSQYLLLASSSRT